MAGIPADDLKTLQNLLQGVLNIVDAPMAFDRGDPDKNRIKEIQALVGLIVRSELSASNGARLLQLLKQLKLLFEEIAGVGTRVTMKPAARLVDQGVSLLQKPMPS